VQVALWRAILALSMVITIAPEAGAQSVKWGDVNGDGTIGAVDAQAILSAVVGLPLPAGFTKANGDANCDGTIGALDAQIVLSFVVGLNVSQFCVGTAPGPVESVQIRLASDRILEGTSTEVARAVLLGAGSDTLFGRAVAWATTDAGIASVDASGRITAKSPGSVNVTASSEGRTGLATIVVEPRSRYERTLGTQWLFIDGSDARMPVWDVGRQGYVPQAGDRREQIVVDENFLVPAGSQVLWEDKIVWIRPKSQNNINISGRLVIRNSLVLWDQSQQQETRFDVKGGGTLRIENSYAFSSNPYWVNWEYEEGSTIVLDHYQGNPWTSMHGKVSYSAANGTTVTMSIFADVRDAPVTITDAASLWFELLLPSGTYQLSVPASYTWGNVQFPGIWTGTTIEASNSYVFRNDVALNNDVHATIFDSPSGVGVGWTIHQDNAAAPYANCELRDLGSPGDDAGVLYSDKTWTLPCNNSSLRLRNTRLLNAWPNIFGAVHLKVFSSNLVDVRNYGSGGSAKPSYEIYNSSAQLFSATNGGLMYIENSTLTDDIQVNGQGSAIYSFGLRKKDGTQLHVSQENGGKYVVLPVAGPPW
jgi:hypothetical protein